MEGKVNVLGDALSQPLQVAKEDSEEPSIANVQLLQVKAPQSLRKDYEKR